MSGIIINLSLAIFWFFLAGGIFTYEALHGAMPWRPLDLSPGWLALLLAVFNCVRVFTTWFYQKQRRQLREESELLRQQFGLHDRPPTHEPPNPNLQFTDRPPEPESKSS